MTLSQWLNSPLYTDKPSPTVVQRLALLVRRNGGFNVRGWGYISGGGLYGHSGLEQDEAMELIHLGGVLTGFYLCGADPQETVRAIESEWQKVMEMQAAFLLAGEAV